MDLEEKGPAKRRGFFYGTVRRELPFIFCNPGATALSVFALLMAA